MWRCSLFLFLHVTELFCRASSTRAPYELAHIDSLRCWCAQHSFADHLPTPTCLQRKWRWAPGASRCIKKYGTLSVKQYSGSHSVSRHGTIYENSARTK